MAETLRQSGYARFKLRTDGDRSREYGRCQTCGSPRERIQMQMSGGCVALPPRLLDNHGFANVVLTTCFATYDSRAGGSLGHGARARIGGTPVTLAWELGVPARARSALMATV
jgi:hypothetical protein